MNYEAEIVALPQWSLARVHRKIKTGKILALGFYLKSKSSREIYNNK